MLRSDSNFWLMLQSDLERSLDTCGAASVDEHSVPFIHRMSRVLCFCRWPLTFLTPTLQSVSPTLCLSSSSSSSSSLCSVWVCVLANCIPQCQNGGMCLGPQHCVCKPGSNGKACEEKTPFPAAPGNGHSNGHDVVPQRPIPQQAPPDGYASRPSNMAQMKLTVKSSPHFIQPHYIQQHIQQR